LLKGLDNITNYKHTGLENITKYKHTGLGNPTKNKHTGLDNLTSYLLKEIFNFMKPNNFKVIK